MGLEETVEVIPFQAFHFSFKALDVGADGSLHEKQQVLLPGLAGVFG